jgi:Family of unknown function (DUF6152)
MSRKPFVMSLTAAAVLVASLGAARAHHSLAAEFLVDKKVEITGTITEMKWTNPHAWLYVNVTDAAGQTQNWAVEFGSPNQLYRRGWSKEDLPAGATVTVVGYAPRDNSQRVSATDVTLPDGRTLFAGTRQED